MQGDTFRDGVAHIATRMNTATSAKHEAAMAKVAEDIAKENRSRDVCISDAFDASAFAENRGLLVCAPAPKRGASSGYLYPRF
jgi:hypothetical protein